MEPGVGAAELTDILSAHESVEIVPVDPGVTAKTAIALGAYFGQTPEFWMNAQTAHALSKALVEHGQNIRAQIRHHAEDRAPL